MSTLKCCQAAPEWADTAGSTSCESEGESCLPQTCSVAVPLESEVPLQRLCHRRWLLGSADYSSLQLHGQAQTLPLVGKKVRDG